MKMPTPERNQLVNNIVRHGRGAFAREELHAAPTEELRCVARILGCVPAPQPPVTNAQQLVANGQTDLGLAPPILPGGAARSCSS